MKKEKQSQVLSWAQSSGSTVNPKHGVASEQGVQGTSTGQQAIIHQEKMKWLSEHQPLYLSLSFTFSNKIQSNLPNQISYHEQIR